MTPKEIINFARDIKEYLGTNNPYKIAEYYGIQVLFREFFLPGFTAQTIKAEKCPTIISINNRYDDFSKQILCSHELGHALLHNDGINNFALTAQNVKSNLEQEANLFAIALLCSNNIDDTLILPLDKLSGYILKNIIEDNLRINE